MADDPRERAADVGRSRGRHDPAEWRQAQRSGRQTGCTLYIAGDELRRMGIDPSGPPPRFRAWTAKDGRPRMVVSFERRAT